MMILVLILNSIRGQKNPLQTVAEKAVNVYSLNDEIPNKEVIIILACISFENCCLIS